MAQVESVPDLLERARGGDAAARGQLLDLFRNYLRLVARSMIRGALRVRLDPSDLVQETYVRAHRDFAQFAGRGESELVAWLRRILVHTLTDQVRYHQCQARDYQRQESLEQLLDRSGLKAQQALASYGSSPSAAATRREQAVRLSDAVARLPADYREVFILRALEHVPLDEIAGRLGRSAGAVRMLWTRAVERLSRMLEEPS